MIATCEVEGLPFHLSTNAKRALLFAQIECERMKHESIGTEHILLGILIEASSASARYLKNQGLGISAARQAVTRLFKIGTEASRSTSLTPTAYNLMANAEKMASDCEDREINCDSIFMLMVETECAAQKVIEHLKAKTIKI